jgi:outer membrane protein OmpA-like peptidoglycan-associated protein
MNLLKPLSVFLVAAALGTVSVSTAYAQEQMTPEEIEALLKPKKLTRSIKATPASDAKKELDEVLSRSIGVVERKKIVELTEKAESPKLDFTIHFGFDSAEIEQDSYGTLDSLAKALKSEALYNAYFLINGHTDAKGSDDYNLDLSQRRADAVVAYLVSQSVDASHLKAIGFGESALKDPGDGESAANRRVEIVTRP